MNPTTLSLPAVLVLVLVAAAGCASSGPPRDLTNAGASPNVPRVEFRRVALGRDTIPYALFRPTVPTPPQGLSLIIFLHGSGERGSDGLRPFMVGLGPAAVRHPELWPALIAFPQLPEQQRWAAREDIVMAVLDDVRSRERVDSARISITGLSNGGQGAWAMASAHPEIWSAVAPVCGFKAGEPGAIAPLPVWAFHGEKDDVVLPQNTRDMIDAIRAAGGTPRVTYYPDANHNAWDAAYAEGELPGFLLQRRDASATK